MVTKPNYDFTKLPKWAYEYIQNLERECCAAVDTLKKFHDSQTPSDFFIDTWTTLKGEKHYIQTDKITVKMGDKEIYINKKQDGSFYLASGFGGLQIEPSASNAIRIKVKQ
jgi:hypothetical protein